MHFPEVFLGTLRGHYIVLFGVAGTFAVMAGFVGAWIGSHFGARRAARRAAQTTVTELTGGRQLQDIVQALDVLTLEVERMSEGHRFIASFWRTRPVAIE